jgi:hypothetical protein
MGSGKWEVGSGKWEVGNGKWELRSLNRVSMDGNGGRLISILAIGYVFFASMESRQALLLRENKVAPHPEIVPNWLLCT